MSIVSLSHRLYLLLLALGAGALVPQLPGAPMDGDSSRLRVLFLGDRGHHLPAARCQDVLAEMHGRGIELTYSERVEDLDPEVLAPYDVVLLYANIDVLPADSERALLDFVAQGRGFVPVHCASFCFRNSDAFVELVGAQFSRHGTGTFTTERTTPHAITRGLAACESWDETYVHTRHNEDRTVLAVRRDEEGAEPWTWVRRHGDGRVFYTAWGHDQRTWTQPAFQDLLERGIRWAAGGEEFLGDSGVERPFTQSESDVPVPNYGRGEYGDMTRMQDPLDPAASLARVALPGELEARIFASEPLIAEPIAITWDERGRLWIAETVDYPNERKEEGGRDRVRIVEDRDGDGVADHTTVFAEGLSIPTGLVHTRHGLVVVQAPDTLLFVDEDGDDQADRREVLFTGWGTGDTHAGPSSLQLGPDGWVWGTVGYSGFRGSVGGVEHRFGQGVVRFREAPSASGWELEYVAPTTNNTWGLGFSEEFDVFASTANGNPSVHVSVANRYYEAVTGFAPRGLATIAESTLFHPVTANVRQVDYHGRFTAAAGHALYTARLFPERYWNRMAFVAEPTGNLVHRFELEQQGSSFVARDAWNLVASDDDWTSPVVAEVGPDGAVWIVDWYSFVVQHNPTPPGFQTGSGNAYVTPLRDKDRARIWRIVPRSHPVEPTSSLAGRTVGELVAALSGEDLRGRTTAQRLLVERHTEVSLDELLDVVEATELDAIGNAPGALHALWTLAQLGLLEGTFLPDVSGGERERLALRAEDALVGALRSPAPALRRAAVQLLPRDEFGRDLILSAGPMDDPDPRVQVEAMLALSEMPVSAAVGSSIVDLLRQPGVEEDPWIADAATCAAARHDTGFLTAVLTLAGGQAEVAAPTEAAVEPENAIVNGNAEAVGAGEVPLGWRPRTYSGAAEHTWGTGGRAGGHAFCVRSEGGADSSWTTSARLDPRARYRLSGWVRTENVEGQCFGALFNVHEIQGAQNARTEGVRGSEDWTQVAIEFDADGHEQVTINALFGGWGQATGTAWFDDITLERLPDPPLGGALGSTFFRTVRHYASRAPVDSVTSVLAVSVEVDSEVRAALMDGLIQGWPDGEGIEANPSEVASLQAIASRLDGKGRRSLVALTERWGQRELLAREVGAVLDSLREDVTLDLPVENRIAAAQRLVLLDDGPPTHALILDQIQFDAEPDLAAGLLEALAASRDGAVGERILEHFGHFTPLAQRQAVRVLRRRGPWTRALFDTIESGELPASVVDLAGWHELSLHPEPDLAARALDLSEGTSSEGEALLSRFADVAQATGEPVRGQALYLEHCARCHRLGGQGELVGPELDGVGQRPRLEILADILDPSRSVETNYQLWTASTEDGRIFSGRLASETRTTIELLDSEGKSTILERGELEVLRPSSLSLMPAGFEEQLGEQGLADLLEYLASVADH